MKLNFQHLILALVISVSAFSVAESARPYWQQDVSYKMDVALGDDGRTLLGRLDFTYKNNSPDTLDELRFHAYYNSFQPGSPAHRRWHARGSRRIENASPEDYGSMIVKNLRDGDGNSITPEFNYSIFSVPLLETLVPGSEVHLTMDFESYIPGRSVAYRSAFAHGQLKCAHWYPQVCVYDPVMGWVDNQYMGTGEEYGEFGIYDLHLTLPEEFIVGGTGVLVNRVEMIPVALRERLDLQKFIDNPVEVFQNKTETTDRTKTWHFHAEDVHDFAWVADPQFLIDQDRCGETDIWILARRDHASGWHDAAEVTRQGIEIMEREVGPFPYPEFTVVDCFSGMEYPGIVFCSGYSPRYKLLFWHEMGHNYFMGAVGSNQTERAFIDEGFTTYWEIRMMEELIGRENIFLTRRGSLIVTDQDRFYRGLRPYLELQKSGYILPLHVESDLPEVYMQYRISSYYKPATAFLALQYYIGKEGIRRVMHDYYAEWKFRHPYEQDFLQSLEKTLGTSMEWFYDAWVRGSKSLDYSIEKAKATESDKVTLIVRREGDMILPVKVRVEDGSGQSLLYYIPILDEPTPPDCGVRLPRWDQRRDPHDRYVFDVDKGEYKYAEVDLQNLLADINPLNNTTSILPPMKWEFDYPFQHVSPVDAYRVRWSPTVFYNGIDGLQGGVYFKGDYLKEWSKLNMAVRVGSLSGQVSGELDYDNEFRSLGSGSSWGFSGYLHEGHRGGEIRLIHEDKKGFDSRVQWRGGIRWFFHELFDRDYLPTPEGWENGQISATVFKGEVFPRFGKITVNASASIETAAPLSDFSYSRAMAEIISSYPISRVFSMNLRGFYGKSTHHAPIQCWIGLGGEALLEQAQSRWLRSWAALPPDWNSRAIGDGDLPGYSIEPAYAYNVASVKVKLDARVRFLDSFTNDLPPRFKPSVNMFCYSGAGDQGDTFMSLRSEDYVAEAGWGVSFRFPEGSLVEIAFPLYLSKPYSDESKWEWRTVLGLSIEKSL